jgi:hypothetical protein
MDGSCFLRLVLARRRVRKILPRRGAARKKEGGILFGAVRERGGESRIFSRGGTERGMFASFYDRS